jgi:YVTN family beta-propeller protein
MSIKTVGRFAALAGALFASSAMGITRDAAAYPPPIEIEEVAATGSMPKGVSISPDKTRIYVTNFGQANAKNISVYDANTLRPLDTIAVPGDVVESVLSPDGKTLYASNFEKHIVQFIDIEKKRVVHEVHTGAHPKILALTRDGKTLFAANWSGASVTQIDTETAKAVRTLPAGAQPRGMVVSSDGHLYIANFNGESIDIYWGEGYSQHERIAACRIPRHLVLSPDEKTLYISCYHDSMLHALDVETRKVVHAIHIGSSPKSIDVSPDGRYVWSADYGKETNSVSVVDTTDWTARVFPVAGMDRGSGIVVTPDGKHAYVTGWYDSHVYLVGFEGGGGHPREALTQIDGWIRRPHHE